ncbi:MAG: DUF4136 domain-containing protein [Sphingomonadales bacterium]
MSALYKTLGMLVIALVVASCANKMTSEVTRFHKLAAPAGETVRIMPKDSAKQGSLEFREYAQLIGDRLGAFGYRPAAPGATPDLLVRVDYKVGEGQVVTRGYPYGYGYAGHFGHHGHHGHHGFHGFYGYPYYGGYGARSITVYPRKLEMDIVRQDTSETIFEGVVDSVGRNKHLNQVMHYLVQAMFDGFPGQHGVTHRVTIKLPDEQASSY